MGHGQYFKTDNQMVTGMYHSEINWVFNSGTPPEHLLQRSGVSYSLTTSQSLPPVPPTGPDQWYRRRFVCSSSGNMS